MRFVRRGTVSLGLACAVSMMQFASLRAAEPYSSEPPKPWVPEILVENLPSKTA
jgi:hypothetical protein